MDSSYYKCIYTECKNDEINYKNNKGELEEIIRRLNEWQNDEIQAINSKVCSLYDDLGIGFRYNNSINIQRINLSYESESYVDSDQHLNNAKVALVQEAYNTEQRRAMAESKRDINKQLYQDQKKKEACQLLGNIF